MAKKLTIDVVDGSVVINGEIVLDRNGWEVSSIDELNVSINQPQSGFYSSNRVGDIEVGGQTYEDYEALAYVLASTLNEEIGGGGSVEVGSGLHLGSGGEIKLGLDPSTLGTTNKGILTEDLFLVLGNMFAAQYSSLQIRQDSFEITSAIDQFNYGHLSYNIFGDNRLSLTRESGSEYDTNIQGINFDDSGMRVQDFGARKGLEYRDDYSANGKLDDRWIPDWGAVKDYVDNNAGSALTFENGLREEDGVVKLGLDMTDPNLEIGKLTEQTYLLFGDMTTYHTGVFIGEPGVEMTYQSAGESVAGSIGVSNLSAQLRVQEIGGGKIDIQLIPKEVPGFQTSGMFIHDSINNKGAEYFDDYSANFTDRSLVDKAYVDNKISEMGDDSVTWATIEGKPAFIAEGVDAAAARTALGLGTAATTDSSAYATAAQGALASSAVQPATLDARLSAAQRTAINALVSPEEDYADMAEATVAIKSIIDALQA